MSFTRKKLEMSYKKLKSNTYFDKSAAILKKQIVEFESIDFEKNMEFLFKYLNSESNEAWEKYFKEKLEKLIVYQFPKAIDNEKENYKEIIINKENESDDINICECDNIQFRIEIPIELQILGTLWVDEIGSKLDREFADISYGNRLLKNAESRTNEEWSPYLYKPYFNEYEVWRDRGLEVAEECYKNKKDCLIIMLDIKRFFYSVNFTQCIFDSFLDEDYSSNKFIVRLNNLVYEVIKKYSEEIHNKLKSKKDNVFLPIGFLPSPILANWYLDNFDKNIIDRSNPSYYGRYVDDMIIVDKVEKNSTLNKLLLEKDDLVDKILKNYFVDIKEPNLIKDSMINIQEPKVVKEGKSTYTIKFTDKLHDGSQLEIKESKFKIFYLKSGGTKAIIDKFKDAIKNNCSEFRLLPDGNNLFLENYNEIYKLEQNESVNKLRGIDGIEIDKYELSKFIGKNLTVANFIDDNLECKFYDDLERIFQPKVIIENYLLWESILSLCIVNKRFDKFELIINKILKSIKKIKEKNEKSLSETYINIKDTLSDYLVSCIIGSSTLVWGKEIPKMLNKLLNLISSKYRKFTSEKIEKIRRGFCLSRMIRKTNISVLVDMFLDNENNIDLSLAKHNLYLNDLSLVLEYIKEFILKTEELPFITYIFEKKTNKQYKYRPYLITMQDISKLLFLSKALSGKVLSESSYEEVEKQSTSEIIEKLYYKINYLKEFQQSVEEEKNNSLIRMLKYKADKKNLDGLGGDEKGNYNVIKISKCIKKSIKVAIAIARNKEENFQGVLMDEPNRTLQRYNELSEIIRQTVESKAEILILPESYIPFEWLGLLEREAKKNNLAIITGVEHIKVGENVYNLIASLFPYEYDEYKFVYTNLRTKVFYSPEEKRQIKGYGYKYVEGCEYNLFVWNNIWMPVYCCFEIASILDRSKFFSLSDLFVVVEWNKDTNYFSNIIESLCRDMHSFCVQVNTANYGDSCLVQPAKSYKQVLLRTKGGLNSGVLVGEINVDNLRRFQVKDYELQKDDKFGFKTTPPNFNKSIVREKIKNKLFEEMEGKYR